MNKIPERQNEPKQLDRLAAQRQLYSTAKRVLAAQAILGGPIAIASVIAITAMPDLKGYAAFWGFFVSLGDLLWLNPWQKRLRENAAKIQEAFDCEVLRLPWNNIKTGSWPESELIKEYADKFRKNALILPPLENWYAPVVGDLPDELARIICQRSNCWWDSKQRRRYAMWIIGGVVIAGIVILGLGLVGGITVEKFFLAVIAPLTPALILGVRQWSEQLEAARRLDKLKEHAETLWNEALKQPHDVDLLSKCRALQDEIFENRRRSPLVFDWIFRRLRDEYEVQMNYGAEELVNEVKRRLEIEKA
jgi:hypothetical protein